jgi:hypothetical protein
MEEAASHLSSSRVGYSVSIIAVDHSSNDFSPVEMYSTFLLDRNFSSFFILNIATKTLYRKSLHLSKAVTRNQICSQL